MTKDEMIQETIEIAAHNMDWFIGIIGVTVAVFAIFQWKFTDSQIQKMKSQILQQVNDTYKSRIEYLEGALKRYKKYQGVQALQMANSLNNKFSKLLIDKELVQRTVDQNDIILTIESIVNNDMVNDITKTVTMKFVEVNLDNFKRNESESIVEPIYKHIMNDKNLKLYYGLSQHLFDSSINEK